MNPHAGKAKLLPVLIDTTRTAREAAGAVAFDKSAVRAAIFDAGKQGFTSCRVGPELPLDLKATAAAAALIAWLAEEGLSYAWEQRAVLFNARPAGEPVFDLVVSWRL